MTITIPNTKKVKIGRLHLELEKAGIPVVSVRDNGDGFEVVLDNPTQAQIDQTNTVVGLHDGSPDDEDRLYRHGGIKGALIVALSSNWNGLPAPVKSRIQAVIDRAAQEVIKDFN